MPKTKTKTAAKKRFRVTKTGKIFHKKGAVSHRTSKERSTARSRRKKEKRLAKAERTRVKKQLGI
jgi:large subunit ribosomal protein L35